LAANSLTLNQSEPDEQGRLVHFEKSFSKKGALSKVLQLATDFAAQKKNPRFAVTHVSNLQTAEQYVTALKNKFGVEKINILPVSPVLGAHAGIGAAAIGIAWSE
jgi:fatty acid-binding protein DegV